MGKKQTLHSQRLLLSRYPNENTVSTIMKDLAPRFQERAGGYTRILKLGTRPGDSAEMAFIEFVDYVPKVKTEVDVKAAGKLKKAAAEAVEAKKKRIRKFQAEARRVLRSK
jgi:large subunit ribosomal protein L17